MHFPSSKIMEHMQKSKNKEDDSSFKAKPFEIQIIICGERKNPKNHSTQLRCRWRDGKSREDGDLHCLRDMQWLHS